MINCAQQAILQVASMFYYANMILINEIKSTKSNQPNSSGKVQLILCRNFARPYFAKQWCHSVKEKAKYWSDPTRLCMNHYKMVI